ncbi:F22C12.19 [Salix purpurea]|uniref:F22C12.19 n=1 Tax=Salix purpurea TaxID=77065 RepID=A0A9Q0QF47_SALPP|nr:F22C12.19 [Salix purpurea]
MDVSVELNYPVDVVVSAAANNNFVMGSDEVLGGDNNNDNYDNIRVSAVVGKEVVEVEESIIANPRAATAASIQHSSSLFAQKDETSSITALEPISLEKVLPLEDHDDVIQKSVGGISKQPNCNCSNGPSWIPRPEEVRVQRRGGKVTRRSSGCSKRPRLSLLEESTGPARVADSKDSSDKLGPHPTEIDGNEKTQSAKKKNNFGRRRGLASFGSAAGGNNYFGLCGLKTDGHDITKLVDHISLNDVLDGTYEPALFQNFAETDVCSNEKMPTCPSYSVSVVENGDSSATDITSSNKDSCNKPQTPANLLDFSFDQPKDTLGRLALPPPKDLESLLLDATKLAASSRHAPDPRPGKQTSRQASLPAFPWSHTFSGQHSRTNSDAVKCSPSRNTCHGRWVRIGDSFNTSGCAYDTFTNLESCAYDETLVPSQATKLPVLGNNVDSLKPWCEWGLSSSQASMTSHALLESEDDMKYQGRDERCPRLLEAAQTLYDIATHVARLNQDGILRWRKKLSQKAMKARRIKPNEKPEYVSAASTSSMEPHHMSRSGMDQIMPTKRPKLSTIRDKKDLDHINSLRKGPINWSAPKSSRSSPNKLMRDSVAESRHSAAYILKEACMMPPPAKVLKRTCNGQQKVRKLMRMG